MRKLAYTTIIGLLKLLILISREVLERITRLVILLKESYNSRLVNNNVSLNIKLAYNLILVYLSTIEELLKKSLYVFISYLIVLPKLTYRPLNVAILL